MPMTILGLSGYYHDSAACLLRDGVLVAAAQEERFTRKRHDQAFPARAARYCLDEAEIDIGGVDHVVFYDKPLAKFERLLDTFVGTAPRGIGRFLAAMPDWLRRKLWLGDGIKRELGYAGRVLFGEHHESHAASAFFPSPFDEAAVLTVDGVGEWATTTLGVGRGNTLERLGELRFPHSLGLLYSAFTFHAGFRVNSGEYKLMGLAPYGKPTYVDAILRHLIDLRDDGSFALDLRYFDYLSGTRMTNRAFAEVFGPPRAPEAPMTQRDMDLARSVQVVTEEVMLLLAQELHRRTGLSDLCLAGGVALNCVANGRLLRDGPFSRIWVQPAANDAGGALGAALHVWHCYLGNPRTPPQGDAMQGSLLGPSFTNAVVRAELDAEGAVYETLADDEVCRRTAQLLDEQQVVGWFQGRMEFGPRALGARSILGDARSPTMQSTINLKIKERESFRPFAPSVLREEASRWFTLDGDSPYMLFTTDVVAAHRTELPAVTHIDGSARVQTVARDGAPRFHALLSAFATRTGCPVLVNTSFNVRGEPIVCRPRDAYRCFMRTGIDALVIENQLLLKSQQPPAGDDPRFRQTYAPD